jgi:hypothetical protein
LFSVHAHPRLAARVIFLSHPILTSVYGLLNHIVNAGDRETQNNLSRTLIPEKGAVSQKRAFHFARRRRNGLTHRLLVTE